MNISAMVPSDVTLLNNSNNNELLFININNNRNISKILEMVVRDFVKKDLPAEVIEEVLSKEYKAFPVMIKNLIEMYQSKYSENKE